jgi:hypothetical protein
VGRGRHDHFLIVPVPGGVHPAGHAERTELNAWGAKVKDSLTRQGQRTEWDTQMLREECPGSWSRKHSGARNHDGISEALDSMGSAFAAVPMPADADAAGAWAEQLKSQFDGVEMVLSVARGGR